MDTLIVILLWASGYFAIGQFILMSILVLDKNAARPTWDEGMFFVTFWPFLCVGFVLVLFLERSIDFAISIRERRRK